MQNTKPLVVAIAALAVVCGFLTPAAPAQSSSKLQVLHAFHGKDGQSPSAGVIFDAAGNLYGTTTWGGNSVACGGAGCGTVFLLTPTANGKWTKTVLHAFNNEDGSVPTAGVIFDGAGDLYGTTSELGYGWGNVFKLSPDGDGKWSETVLHAFSTGGTEYPFGGVIFDTAGALYGTTYLGGDYKECSDGGCGTVFKVAHGIGGKWSYTTIHDFNVKDGYSPNTGLIRDAAGNLYGAAGGGAGKGGIYGGVVFKLTRGADGRWTDTVLHSFGKGDLLSPIAVIFDQAGNLYGAAWGGGVYKAECDIGPGCGGVFELMPGADGKWTEKVLYTFDGRDGATPDAALAFDAAGNLYGTTKYGGVQGYGTVFKLTPHSGGEWTETVLHSFNGKDGAEPEAGLVFDAAGSLYGTTYLGGNFGECPNFDGCGVVFKLIP